MGQPAHYTAIADAIISTFDRVTALYYDAGDREKRYVEVEDRRGKRTQAPLVSLSIAIVTNEGREFHHAAQIADVAAQLKRYAKARPGSLWVKDQRGNAVE